MVANGVLWCLVIALCVKVVMLEREVRKMVTDPKELIKLAMEARRTSFSRTEALWADALEANTQFRVDQLQEEQAEKDAESARFAQLLQENS